MAEKSLSQVSFFSPEFVDPRCLEPGSVPWMLARFGSRLLPAWLFEGTVLAAPDGSEQPVSEVIVAHRNARGDAAFFSTVMRDIRLH